MMNWKRFIIVNVLLCLALIISAVGFIELMADVLEREEITYYDRVIVDRINELANPFITNIVEIITMLGSEFALLFFLFLLIFFLKTRQYKKIYLLTAIAIGGNILVISLKELILRTRPVMEIPIYQAEGYSFPSGHATIAMCLYGLLIFLILRYTRNLCLKIILFLLLVLIIALVGLSRIYLGVHYPSDVLAGYLLGFFWVSFCIIIYNFFTIKENSSSTRVLQ